MATRLKVTLEYVKVHNSICRKPKHSQVWGYRYFDETYQWHNQCGILSEGQSNICSPTYIYVNDLVTPYLWSVKHDHQSFNILICINSLHTLLRILYMIRKYICPHTYPINDHGWFRISLSCCFVVLLSEWHILMVQS